MIQSRRRRFKVAVYLDELPHRETDPYGNIIPEEDIALWQDCLEAAESVLGQPDTSYSKGQNMLVAIPSDCDYLSNGNKLHIIRDKKLCPRCLNSLLEQVDDCLICWDCERVYELS